MATTVIAPQGGAEIGGEADVGFTHGSGPADNDVIVEWDFDGDGDFSESIENITTYVVEASSRTGRDWPSQINGKAGPGTLRVAVRNDDDRFSYFNAASPLNTPPFSLALGRAIRVRTSTSTPTDPVLLAKDRFNGTGALGGDELGKAWTNQTSHQWSRNGTGKAMAASTIASATDEAIATVDIGASDCYLQATIDSARAFNSTAVLYRFTDLNNFGFVGLAGSTLYHYTRAAGVETLHETFTLGWRYVPATIGVLVSGSNVTGYLGGVPVFTGATALSSAATQVGIAAFLSSMIVDDFRAWDCVPAINEGVLWTGDVTSVTPSVDRSHDKVAEIVAEGRLAKLATQQVTTGAHLFGEPTGIQVGEVLAAAELLHPPGPIDLGDITTGAVHFDRDQALELARRLEETEIGFLHETPEGNIGYDERSARVSASPVAWWSDAPNAQFRYEEIRPFDWRREIFNRAIAGLAPRCPTWPDIADSSDFNSTAAGAQNDVDVTMPTPVAAGDLLLVLIASTVQKANQQWLVPHGWKQVINEGDSYRPRVYAKVALGTEAGLNVKFFDDTTTFSGGNWQALIWKIPAGDWYGSLDGVVQANCVVADAAAGEPASAAYSPPALPVPWGTDPAFFMAARVALTSSTGGSQGSGSGPLGYLGAGIAGGDGVTNAHDLSINYAWKIDSVATEDPGDFGSEDFGGYLIVAATTVAVRGWNGDPPLNNGRQVVQVDNTVSQDRHNMVRTYPTVPELFGSEADAEAYCERISTIYGDNRPIFAIEWTANKSAAYRAQAYRRRVGDLIHLTADGDTGMGVDADYFIESIAHRWFDGGEFWTVVWELSPA